MNIFTNYEPNKYELLDDQDPTWMNDRIKSQIQWKNSTFKKYVKNNKTAYDYQKLKLAITEFLEYIMERYNKYNFQLSQSLNNRATKPRTYWTILKTFDIGKKCL